MGKVNKTSNTRFFIATKVEGVEEYAQGEEIVIRVLHRLDGPAIEYADGSKRWCIDGNELTEEEFNKHPLVIEYRLGKITNEVLNEN